MELVTVACHWYYAVMVPDSVAQLVAESVDATEFLKVVMKDLYLVEDLAVMLDMSLVVYSVQM